MSIESTENTEKSSSVNPAQPDVGLEKTTEKVAGKKGKDKAGRKKKVKRHVEHVVVHINASFNNTKITVADLDGNSLTWSFSGERKFRGSRKSTPFAGQVAAMHALQKAKELYGIQTAKVRVKGPGPGRDAAIRAVRDFATIIEILDVTPVPHNGCRAPKERRV